MSDLSDPVVVLLTSGLVIIITIIIMYDHYPVVPFLHDDMDARPHSLRCADNELCFGFDRASPNNFWELHTWPPLIGTRPSAELQTQLLALDISVVCRNGEGTGALTTGLGMQRWQTRLCQRLPANKWRAAEVPSVPDLGAV